MPDDPLITVTLFPDLNATSMRRVAWTTEELAEETVRPTASTKEALPMLKLGSFGDVRSAGGSLRHNDNLLMRSGVELDYDGEKISPEDAEARLQAHAIESIVYTSPQHRLNGHGSRLRILAPFEQERTPVEANRFLNRIAGLFRTDDGAETVIASESWTPSQAYFYGRITNNPEHHARIIEGKRIDHPLHDALDRTALPNPGRLKRPGETMIATPGIEPLASIADIRAALAAIPNDDGPADWNAWNYFLMAIHAASGGSEEGFAAALEWSSRHPSFDPDLTEERWQHLHRSPPKFLGYGTLAYRARQHDPEFRAPSWDGLESAAEALEEGEAIAAPTDAPEVKLAAEARPQSPHEDPWPVMGEAAFHGPAGEIVRTIAPRIEADPVNVLAQLLIAFGNVAGREVFVQIGPTQHHARLFGVLVGRTAIDRKGTGYNYVRAIMGRVDREWRAHSGLVSGEGLVHAVRDPLYGWNKKGEPVLKDAGIEDKRLLIVEPEFASVLIVMSRPGNTTSPKLRMAWDGDTLQGLGKTSPETATDPHISLIGHITIEEYRDSLDQISMANGFANRFLNILVKRANIISLPEALDDEIIDKFADRLRQAVRDAPFGAVELDAAAKRLWDGIYRDELTVPQPGLYGHLVARAAAQTIRLALIYAVLDSAARITTAHIKAAMAFWQYCAASTGIIFGEALGNPIADELLKMLRQCMPEGLTRTQISGLLHHNYTRERIGRALALLLKHGKARFVRQATHGAPVEIWFAVPPS
jgi:hypothetical protein